MKIFKNKFIVILGTFLIALLVIGGTYAYYSWNTSDAQKTNVAFTVSLPDISASINGTGSYTASNLVPTTCDGTNSIRETVTINYMNGTSYPVVLTANLRLTSFDLHNAAYQPTKSELGALRWMISESNESCVSNSSDVIIGNKFDVLTFNSGQVNPSNSLPLTIGTIQFSIPANTNDEKTYYLYIWLDNSYTHENVGSVNSDPLQELTFSAQWDGKVEQDFGSNTNTEGYPVTISNSHGFGLTNYKIYGNSIQSGIPSPSSPQEVRSLGNGGKNLFDKSIGLIKSIGAEKSITETGFRMTAYVSTGPLFGYIVVGKISDYAGKTYTLSTNISSSSEKGGSIRIYVADKNITTTTSIANISYTNTASSVDEFVTFTVDSSYSTSNLYLVLSAVAVGFNSSVAGNWCEYNNVQLEEGSSVTNYRPYNYIDVNVSGKNLFNIDDIEYGLISSNGSEDTSTVYNKSKFIKVTTPFTVSATPTGAGDAMRVALYDENKNFISRPDYTMNVPVTITTPNVSYIKLSYAGGTHYGKNAYYYDVQVEEGTSATEYEPYQEQTTTINLAGHEPLRKIGSVSDYIDYENQQIIRNIGKIELDTLNYEYNDQLKRFTAYISNIVQENVNGNYGKSLCSQYKYDAGIWANYTVQYGYVVNYSSLIFRNLNYDDAAIFKSSLSDAMFYYQLSTPIPEPISLPRINTNPGTNIISIEGNIVPSKITVAYDSN